MVDSKGREIIVEIRAPDARRDGMDMARRVTKLKSSVELPDNIPMLPYNGTETGHRRVMIPAVVEVQCRLVDLKKEGNRLHSSWVIWGGPNEPKVQDKLKDLALLHSALDPLLARMVSLEARKKETGFGVLFCPVRVGGVEDDPFFEPSFYCRDPRKLARANAEATARYMSLLALWNWLAGELYGMIWKPEGYQEDPWHADPLVSNLKQMLDDRAGEMVAASLWAAWIADNPLGVAELLKQGIRAGELKPTRLRAGTQAGRQRRLLTQQRTLYFKET